MCCIQACKFIEQEDDTKYKVNLGFVPNMRVPGYFYVNDRLKSLIFEELQHACQRGGHGGFLPAVQQLANVAGLPGIVKASLLFYRATCKVLCHFAEYSAHLLQKSIALPDVHSGYGFAIGNVAAFDMADPESIVSPGGVGFDINCGVRLIRTNLVSSHHASHLIESSIDEFSILGHCKLRHSAPGKIQLQVLPSQHCSAYEVSTMLYTCQFVACPCNAALACTQ